jgi:DNA-binding XRE family transcriptional regulator
VRRRGLQRRCVHAGRCHAATVRIELRKGDDDGRVAIRAVIDILYSSRRDADAADEGKSVALAAKELKYSQTQMAAVMGVTSNTIARWERGVVRIPGPAVVLAKLMLEIHKLKIKADAHKRESEQT